MSDNQRHRYEISKQRVHPIITGTSVAIEVGDLLYWNPAYKTVFPASNLAWTASSKYETQYKFRQLFAGMSADRYRGTADKFSNIMVDTAGIKEFSIASGTYYYGQLVAPTKQTGNLLENQKVEIVTDESIAIGRISMNSAALTTKVLVDLFDPTTLARSVQMRGYVATGADQTAGKATIPFYSPITMFSLTVLRAGAILPAAPLVGYSVTGDLELSTNGATYIVTTGDTYIIVYKPIWAVS